MDRIPKSVGPARDWGTLRIVIHLASRVEKERLGFSTPFFLSEPLLPSRLAGTEKRKEGGWDGKSIENSMTDIFFA